MDKLTSPTGLDHMMEETLRKLPLEEAPPALMQNVMANLTPRPQMQASPQPVDLPPFRLKWMDVVLSLFFAGMAGLVLLVAWSVPPELELNLTWELYRLRLYDLHWVMLAGIGMCIMALLFAAVLVGKRYIFPVQR